MPRFKGEFPRRYRVSIPVLGTAIHQSKRHALYRSHIDAARAPMKSNFDWFQTMDLNTH